MSDRQSDAEKTGAETDIATRSEASGWERDRTRWQGSRRRFLGTTAGVVALSLLGTGGHSVVAAQQDQWADPPGIDREFTFDTGQAVPATVQYEHADNPADAMFDLSGTAPAGPEGNATGAWLAEYDGQGNERYSTTIYDPEAGYPTWNDWFYRVFSTRSGQSSTFVLGVVENTGGDPAALYAARIENDTDVPWTTTFAADVDWTDDRIGRYSLSLSSDTTVDPGVDKIATGGTTDPVAHDDWVATDGTVTRNITVSDPGIDRVDSVSHDTDNPWLYMIGTGTDGGVFAQAASPDAQAEWQTSLAEFDDETFLAGSFNSLSGGESAYAIVSDAAGSGDWIKTLDNDGNVVNSATFTPPSGGDSAVGAQRQFFGTGAYFTIGPASDGSWVRSVTADLSVEWTTTLDGLASRVRRFGGSGGDGFLVRGRRDDAPTFWRLASDGTVQWDATLGDNRRDFLLRTRVGPEDALVLGGRRSTSEGNANPWLARLDATDGTVEWQETYGGAAWDNPAFPEQADDGLLFADTGDSPVDVLELSPVVDRDPDDPTDGPPDIVGEDPPTDPDGDGLYEDIDGDGEFTIADVQLFFQNRDSDVVQNNAEFFNFDGQEPVDVSVGDVQALFQQFTNQDASASDAGGDR